MNKKNVILLLVLLFAITMLFIRWNSEKGKDPQSTFKRQTIHVGFFPNITHAAPLIGFAKGTFQQYVGNSVVIDTKLFNAGPSEMEALFANAIDIGFIGPGPAIQGLAQSEGKAVVIIGGSAAGGASLILQPEIFAEFERQGAKALIGKKIASPQQGNTQDISLRHYLQANGILGKTEIIPLSNADQLTIFSRKELDGSWAPEPWATILISQGGGKLAIDERSLWTEGKFSTTIIVARTDFFASHKELILQFLKAHAAIIKWINTNPEEAQGIANREIQRLTKKSIPDEIISNSWQKVNFTTDPYLTSMNTVADWAYQQKFLKDNKFDIIPFADLSLLNEATTSKPN